MIHTPEPWIFTQYDLNGVLITAIECGEECFADDVDPAVGKRIVDCVNACAGMQSPADEISRLKAERDDLLAALGGLVDCYCSVSPDLTRDERINHRRTLSKAQILILEVRKNKGGAA